MNDVLGSSIIKCSCKSLKVGVDDGGNPAANVLVKPNGTNAKYLGGVVGKNEESMGGGISNCNSSAVVGAYPPSGTQSTGASYVGGFAGYTDESIIDGILETDALVKGYSYVGGIVGNMPSPNIKDVIINHEMPRSTADHKVYSYQPTIGIMVGNNAEYVGTSCTILDNLTDDSLISNLCVFINDQNVDMDQYSYYYTSTSDEQTETV